MDFSSLSWKRMLASLTGSVDQELLWRNEYLATEDRILKSHSEGRLRRTDPQRISLAQIGQRLGRKALEAVAQIVRPETILGWHRRFIAKKFDGSKSRSWVGRAPTVQPIEDLVLPLARENRSWGYRRMAGALILSGEPSLRQVLSNFAEPDHRERNHQGQGNAILFPAAAERIGSSSGKIQTREGLGGLLKFYYRQAA